MGWFGEESRSERVQRQYGERQQAGHAHARQMNDNHDYRTWFRANQEHKVNEFNAALAYAKATGGTPQYRSPAEVEDLPQWFAQAAPPAVKTGWFGFAPSTVVIAAVIVFVLFGSLIGAVLSVVMKALAIIIPIVILGVAGYFVWKFMKKSGHGERTDATSFDDGVPVVTFMDSDRTPQSPES